MLYIWGCIYIFWDIHIVLLYCTALYCTCILYICVLVRACALFRT